MIIQFLLIAVLLSLIIWVIRARKTSRSKAYKKIFLVVFICIAIIAVLFPNLTTTVARFVGVGRGADLLLYGLTVAFIFQLLNTYVKDREKQHKITVLARKITLLETEIKEKNNPTISQR